MSDSSAEQAGCVEGGDWAAAHSRASREAGSGLMRAAMRLRRSMAACQRRLSRAGVAMVEESQRRKLIWTARSSSRGV